MMTIKSEYQSTVTYGIYNQNDSVHAIALKDGTLTTGDSQEWKPPAEVGNTVHIIFKQGLVQVASRDVPKSGTTQLSADGSISIQ